MGVSKVPNHAWQIADSAQDQGRKRAQRNVEKDAGLSCAFITCCCEAQIEMKKVGSRKRDDGASDAFPDQRPSPTSGSSEHRGPPVPIHVETVVRDPPLPFIEIALRPSVSGAVFQIAGLCKFNSAQASACSCTVRHSAPQLSAPDASTPTPAHGRAPSQPASHADPRPAFLTCSSANLDPCSCPFMISVYCTKP